MLLVCDLTLQQKSVKKLCGRYTHTQTPVKTKISAFVVLVLFLNFRADFRALPLVSPADLGLVGAAGVLGEQTASARALERGYLSAPQRF